MSKLKLSFALVIAILTMGITAVTHAKNSDKKFVTDCYQFQAPGREGMFFSIRLTDASASSPQFETLVVGEPAINAAADIGVAPYLRMSIITSPVDPYYVCSGEDKFCCVRFELAQFGDSNYANIPVTTISGWGSGKWKVAEVYYYN